MTISLEHAIRMIVEGKLEKNVNPARKVGPAGGDWEEASEDERSSKAKEAIVKSTATPGQKTVGEGFLGFGKKEKPAFAGPRFPDSAKANDWMSAKVDHMKKHDPENAHHLFSPASGEYMPKDVHVGSSWKPEHEKHYSELKKQNPDLVDRAKKVTTGIAGRVSLSRVGPLSDYHGVSLPTESVSEEEDLEEVSKEKVGVYFDKKIKKVTSPTDKKNLKGVDLAAKKLGGSAKVNATEELEELDEVSVTTTNKKAKSDKDKLDQWNNYTKKLDLEYDERNKPPKEWRRKLVAVHASEETAVGTVERRKIENVGRPTSTRKALVKQNEIRKKIIDEQARRINTIQCVVAKKTKEEKDEINDKSAVEGVTKTIASPGTTPVVINPKLAKPGPNTAS